MMKTERREGGYFYLEIGATMRGANVEAETTQNKIQQKI